MQLHTHTLRPHLAHLSSHLCVCGGVYVWACFKFFKFPPPASERRGVVWACLNFWIFFACASERGKGRLCGCAWMFDFFVCVPKSEGGPFVWACFNRNLKIKPDVWAVWMALLRGAPPGSVLWLRYVIYLSIYLSYLSIYIICIHIHMYTCMYVYICGWRCCDARPLPPSSGSGMLYILYIYIHTYVYIYMYVCRYVCMYVYIYIYI
jgi:hypothetical protein